MITILTRITGLFGLIGLLGLFIPLIWFLLWLYMLISTYQGKTIVLPVIGPLAKKQAGV